MLNLQLNSLQAMMTHAMWRSMLLGPRGAHGNLLGPHLRKPKPTFSIHNKPKLRDS